MAQDVSLLFGVLGEGSLSGESGRLIQDQLNQIMTELNKKPLNVKIGIDTSSGGKKSWSGQLQEKLDKISASGKFSAQISTLKLSPGAVNDFKKQLATIVNTVGLSTGTKITISADGIGEIEQKMDQTENAVRKVGEAADDSEKKIKRLSQSAREFGRESSSAQRAISDMSHETEVDCQKIIEYTTQLDVLKTVFRSVESVFRTASFGNGMLRDPSNIQRVTDAFNELKDRINDARGLKIDRIEELECENELIKQQANDLIDLVASLQRVEAASISANGKVFPSSEYMAQLTALKTVVDSVTSTFKSAIFGKNMIGDSDAIQEVTNKFIECTVKAKEAQAVSIKDDAEMKRRVSILKETAREFDNLVSVKRQFEAPSADFVTQYREVQAIIKAVRSNFDSIVSGRKGIVSEKDLASARSLYSLVEEISRRVSNIKAGDIDSLQKELPALKSIISDVNELSNSIKQVGNHSTDAAKDVARFKLQLEDISKSKSSIYSAKESLKNSVETKYESVLIGRIEEKYHDWAIAINTIKELGTASPERMKELAAEGASINDLILKIKEERKARSDLAEEIDKSAKSKVDDAKKAELEQKKRNAALKAYSTLLAQMQNAEKRWSAAKNGVSSANYIGIQSGIESLKQYKTQLDNGKISADEFSKKLGEMRLSFAENSTAIKAAGENTRTFTQRFGTLAEKFGTWLSVSQIVMACVRSVKQMASAVIELDDAMTQLKIVTRDTDEAYERYLETVSKTAVKVGSSIKDLVDSTTTYARLGYSLDESSKLAEYTSMLQNVGDIDVSDAQDAITAIVKAFGVGVDEIESIMDKMVIAGRQICPAA